MFRILLALHLLFAIFAIGPLVGAATIAARGLRGNGNAPALAASARALRLYTYASVLVVLFGFGLMSADSPFHEGQKVAEFSDVWIWLSTALWVVAVAVVLGVLAPSLDRARTVLTTGTGAPPRPDNRQLTARVAASGGIVALIFAAIVFLMVYRPGA